MLSAMSCKMGRLNLKQCVQSFAINLRATAGASVGLSTCFLKSRQILLDKNMAKLKIKTSALHKNGSRNSNTSGIIKAKLVGSISVKEFFSKPI